MELSPQATHNAHHYEDLACSSDERWAKNWHNSSRNINGRESPILDKFLDRVKSEKLSKQKLSLDFNNGKPWSKVSETYKDALRRKEPANGDRYSKYQHSEIRDDKGNLKGITEFVFVDNEDYAVLASTTIKHLKIITNA